MRTHHVIAWLAGASVLGVGLYIYWHNQVTTSPAAPGAAPVTYKISNAARQVNVRSALLIANQQRTQVFEGSGATKPT